VFGAVQIRHVSILHERGRSLSTQNNAERLGPQHMLWFAGHSFPENGALKFRSRDLTGPSHDPGIRSNLFYGHFPANNSSRTLRDNYYLNNPRICVTHSSPRRYNVTTNGPQTARVASSKLNPGNIYSEPSAFGLLSLLPSTAVLRQSHCKGFGGAKDSAFHRSRHGGECFSRATGQQPVTTKSEDRYA